MRREEFGLAECCTTVFHVRALQQPGHCCEAVRAFASPHANVPLPLTASISIDAVLSSLFVSCFVLELTMFGKETLLCSRSGIFLKRQAPLKEWPSAQLHRASTMSAFSCPIEHGCLSNYIQVLWFVNPGSKLIATTCNGVPRIWEMPR